ncbi:hypothetical protein L291_4211 [Acinetobacter guillouiae MSP4-18]|nr:hypothetical protein L291_4211 [Acinetobacter guillouiae MSP4-18]
MIKNIFFSSYFMFKTTDNISIFTILNHPDKFKIQFLNHIHD